MTKLRLGPIANDKPVRLTIELPAAVHRDLIEYARLLSRESGQDEIMPAKLVVPMLARFMETDRGFRKQRRKAGFGGRAPSDPV
ncbi:hypothetical protein AA103196_1112 [Ameyamaea chiangmaiensis NBRC 103196]|uniref:DUF2274 domain-containing protein n=3 Tax=Acetobacteraceae TaxID=433 RepID=A0A850PIK1_9PROT|nr:MULTISPECIES: DUF2274 domain-containing protein [Acetobacteraceae]MBB2199059.1 DUF2274 domain-containing protein [Gluconacetobacter dulcium]MBO1361089.1 DUF2274 domain-containing protein [Acetobacter sacchari]MBS4076349.1 DUF2274 domain-containing protein [Ameyamaea chiangmaiensis]NVN41071.1 DUF2274 domain-containing protein [Ameyamaea chiangmaiensis]GBQ65343.1 hypothetical protein AA103196_1112 [Ameyamaea chiangmaiensis NBRC 103196]